MNLSALSCARHPTRSTWPQDTDLLPPPASTKAIGTTSKTRLHLFSTPGTVVASWRSLPMGWVGEVGGARHRTK